MGEGLTRFLLTLLALVLPPVAVYAKAGHHWQLYLNIFFCLAFYIPAILHAVWFVRRKPRRSIPDPEELDYAGPNDAESGEPPRVEPRLDW